MDFILRCDLDECFIEETDEVHTCTSSRLIILDKKITHSHTSCLAIVRKCD